MDLKKKLRDFFSLSRKSKGGFTLVELIVVIAVLAILGGVAVPAYSGYVTKANQAADEELLAALNRAYTVACVENGEYDMKELSIEPETVGDIKTQVVINHYNESFQRYFEGGGVFKYYDDLEFNSAVGVFVGENIAALAKALKNDWDGSSFAVNGNEMAEMLLMTFDQIGTYFGVNGFSLDGLLASAPEEVREAFGFGTFDLTDEQILERYVNGYAKMTDEEKSQWKTDNGDKIDAITGNAYILRMAEDAAGRSAETILGNLNDLMGALATTPTSDEVIAYYKKVKNIPEGTTVDYETAKKALAIGPKGEISAEMIVAVGTSGVKNTSGVSTLGSMYAIAAGFFNNAKYYTGDKPTDYGSIDAFMKAASDTNFSNYLKNQAQTDISTYLNFMSYLTAGDVDMTTNSAFAGQYKYIAEALGLTNATE